MERSKFVRQSTIEGLSKDLEDELEDVDLSDKKVTVHVSQKDKIKVKQEYVLLFLENFSRAINELTKSEIQVLMSIGKFCHFQNVFSITQASIANDTGIERANVSRALKKLRDKKLILKDMHGTEYLNPYLFIKGGIKEFKASEKFQQMSLHFEDDNIQNPF